MQVNNIKTRLTLFVLFFITMFCFSIFVYLHQSDRLDISADTENVFTYHMIMDNISLRNVLNFTDGKLFTIDDANTPHILAGDSNHNLTYLTKKNNAWEKSDLEINQSIPGGYGQIAIDSNGFPFIAYQLPGGKLKLKYFDGLNWTVDDVSDFDLQRGLINGLVVDSKNQPYILYQPEIVTNKDRVLIHKDKNSGKWSQLDLDIPLSQNQSKVLMRIYDDVLVFACIPVEQHNPKGENNKYIEIVSYSLKNKSWNNIKRISPTDSGLSQIGLFNSINDFEVYENSYHLLIVASENEQKQGMYYITNTFGDCEGENVQELFNIKTGLLGLSDRTVPTLALDTYGNPSLVTAQISAEDVKIDYLYRDNKNWRKYSENISDLSKNFYRCVSKMNIDTNFFTNIVLSCVSDGYGNSTTYYISGKIIQPYENMREDLPEDDSNYLIDTGSSSIDQINQTHSSNLSSLQEPIDNRSGNDLQSVRKLVSTGASFWLNLIISLIMIIGVGYFIFRKEIHRVNN